MQPDPVVKEGHERLIGYYKLSRHFKWALHQVFDILYFHQVIVLEDDMELAVDFFDYFEAFLPVLRADDTLYCISAWNDNGLEEFVEDPTVFFR